MMLCGHSLFCDAFWHDLSPQPLFEGLILLVRPSVFRSVMTTDAEQTPQLYLSIRAVVV